MPKKKTAVPSFIMCLNVDGTTERLTTDHLEDVRKLINAQMVEVVRINHQGIPMVLLVDEDGGPRGLPLNLLASTFAQCPIVGTAVLSSNPNHFY